MTTETPPLIQSKTVCFLKPGFAWNPLLSLPRNSLCPCDSGLKFKKCHLPTMPRAIPEKIAKEWINALKTLKPLKFVEDEKNPKSVI